MLAQFTPAGSPVVLLTASSSPEGQWGLLFSLVRTTALFVAVDPSSGELKLSSPIPRDAQQYLVVVQVQDNRTSCFLFDSPRLPGGCSSQATVALSVAAFDSCPASSTTFVTDGSTTARVSWTVPQLNSVGTNLFVLDGFALRNSSSPGTSFPVGITEVVYETTPFGNDQVLRCAFQITVYVGLRVFVVSIGSRRLVTSTVNYLFSTVPGLGTAAVHSFRADLARDAPRLEFTSQGGEAFQILAGGAPLRMQLALALCLAQATASTPSSLKLPVAATVQLTDLVVSLSNTDAPNSTGTTVTAIELQAGAWVDDTCVYINGSTVRDLSGLQTLTFRSVLVTLGNLSASCASVPNAASLSSRCASSTDTPRQPQPLLLTVRPGTISFSLLNQSAAAPSLGQSPFVFQRDITAPTAMGCPADQTIELPANTTSDQATLRWTAPAFIDNVAVTRVVGPSVLSVPYSAGSDVLLPLSPRESPVTVTYQAWDAAGNTASCSFTLAVTFVSSITSVTYTLSTAIVPSLLRPSRRRRRRHLSALSARNADDEMGLEEVVNDFDLASFTATVAPSPTTNAVALRLEAPAGLRVVVAAVADGLPAVALHAAVVLSSVNCSQLQAEPLGDEYTMAAFDDLRDLQGRPLAWASPRWLLSDSRSAASVGSRALFFGGVGSTLSSGFSFTALTLQLNFPLGRSWSINNISGSGGSLDTGAAAGDGSDLTATCAASLALNSDRSSIGMHFYLLSAAINASGPPPVLVAVRDFDPPVWHGCSAGVNSTASTSTTMSSNGSQTVSWDAPTASDNIGVVWTNETTRPGTLFAITVAPATHTVTYLAVDAAGNTARCVFPVRVTDTTVPVVDCPATTIRLNYSAAATLVPLTAVAFFVAENSADVMLQFALFNASSSVNTSDGFLTSIDAHAQTLSFRGVKSVSQQQWLWSAATSAMAATTTGTAAAESTASPASTRITTSISTTTTTTTTTSTAAAALPAFTVVPGTYTLHLQARDATGNRGTCTASVIVVDITPPVFTRCPASHEMTVNLAAGAQYNVTWTVPAVTDDYTVTLIETLNRTGVDSTRKVLVPGQLVLTMDSAFQTTLLVQYVAQDVAGNRAVCDSQLVISNFFYATGAGSSNNGGDSGSSGLSMPIVGGIVGGVVLLAVVVAVLVVRRNKRRQKPADFGEFLTRLEAVMTLGGGTGGSTGARKPREIKREHIKIVETIGKGQFGTVDKAIVDERRGGVPGYLCAVKQLLSVAAEDATSLLEESAVLAQLDSDFCVRLIGVVTIGKPMMMVVEYCEHGALNTYLARHGLTVSEHQRLVFAGDCAEGLVYLSSKSFIHRDVAARNVLVSSELRAKISDFGMAREQEETEYYHSRGGALPVRWCAPEVLEQRKFSVRSDMWAAGVLLYEIWTNGATPYGDWSNERVWTKITAGHRLPQPEGCSAAVYDVMINCWREDPHERTTADEMVAFFRRGVQLYGGNGGGAGSGDGRSGSGVAGDSAADNLYHNASPGRRGTVVMEQGASDDEEDEVRRGEGSQGVLSGGRTEGRARDGAGPSALYDIGGGGSGPDGPSAGLGPTVALYDLGTERSGVTTTTAPGVRPGRLGQAQKRQPEATAAALYDLGSTDDANGTANAAFRPPAVYSQPQPRHARGAATRTAATRTAVAPATTATDSHSKEASKGDACPALYDLGSARDGRAHQGPLVNPLFRQVDSSGNRGWLDFMAVDDSTVVAETDLMGEAPRQSGYLEVSDLVV